MKYLTICLVLAVSSNALAQGRPGNQQVPAAAPLEKPQGWMPQFDTYFRELADDGEVLGKVPVSIKEEREFGRAMVAGYLMALKQQGLKVIDRGRDVEYLSDLVSTIRPKMKNAERYSTIKVYLIDSRETDARSFPGGTLFFSDGLLEFAQSEAAILGIVGHELSHLDRGHQLVPLQRSKFADKTFREDRAFQDLPELMSAVRTSFGSFVRPFRPEHERDADSDGAKWAYQAGYDPREMADLFLRLYRRDGEQPNAAIPFLRSHPFRIERYHAINQQYAELQKTSPTGRPYIGQQNLKLRITRAKLELKEP